METDGKDTKVQVVADDGVPLAVIAESSPSEEATKLYKGKDYKQWVNIFHREQEITEIGDAMRAMELLSRDTPNREDAARETLEMASRYGTMRIDNNFSGFSAREPEPALRFMGYLLDVYPNYLPTPGLVQIETQMADGNDRARTASVMLLENFLTGKWGNVGYEPGDLALASKPFHEMAQSQVGRERLARLLENLGGAIDDKTFGDSMMQEQWSTARLLLDAVDGRVITPTWVDDYAISQVQSALAKWRKREIDPATGKTVSPPPREIMMGGGFGGGSTGPTEPQMVPTPPKWLLPPDVLTAAIELRSAGKLDFPTQFAVEVFTDPSFQNYDESYRRAFDAIMTLDDAAPLVVQTVQDRLIDLLTQYNETKDAAELTQNGFTAQQGPSAFLSLAGPYYAKQVDDVAAAEQVVNEILDAIKEAGDPYKANYLAIDKILRERAGD